MFTYRHFLSRFKCPGSPKNVLLLHGVFCLNFCWSLFLRLLLIYFRSMNTVRQENHKDSGGKSPSFAEKVNGVDVFDILLGSGTRISLERI